MGWGDETTAKYFEIMEPAGLLSAEAFSLRSHMLFLYSSGLSSVDTKGSECLLFLLGPHLYHTTNLTGLLESHIPNAVIWVVNLSTLGFFFFFLFVLLQQNT